MEVKKKRSEKDGVDFIEREKTPRERKKEREGERERVIQEGAQIGQHNYLIAKAVSQRKRKKGKNGRVRGLFKREKEKKKKKKKKKEIERKREKKKLRSVFKLL